MNVIFLDFDGPLFSDRAIRIMNDPIPEHLQFVTKLTNYWQADPIAIKMFNQLNNIHNFKYVISSAWAKMFNKPQLQSLLGSNQFEGIFHDDWTIWESDQSINRHQTRSVAIHKWLERNQDTTDYIIIDDPNSGEDFFLNHGLRDDRLIIVDSQNGISGDDFTKMFDIVKQWHDPSYFQKLIEERNHQQQFLRQLYSMMV
jgi:hypothetical protein